MTGRNVAAAFAAVAAVMLQAGIAQAQAQDSDDADATALASEVVTLDPLAAKVPFGPGEYMRYKLKVGPLNAGEGFMAVRGVQTVEGHPTYHLQMGMKGSPLFGAVKVNDLFESWLDTRQLVSRRFVKDLHENSYESYRAYALYPEDGYWERTDMDRSEDLPTALPLDEIAFVYFIRTLPLEVGQTYTFNRYFKKDGNPVVIKVLRKEVKEVPAGTFNTIVIQPIIQTSGLFSEGGEAELYFTDDEDRYLVYMRTKLPIFSMTLHLEEVTRGRPIHTQGSPQVP
ncbi:MAG: hypothetical protein BMS9Abin29_1814 [Gemmatimonadota bacterium]|nr:MAG: hypothetical protein BMS9Abin29_1814 [Gemmatimonadota bacterium]